MTGTTLRHTLSCVFLVWLLSVSRAWSQPDSGIPELTPELIEYVLNPESRIAEVGDQAIWSNELLPTINQMVEEYQGKAPQSEIDQQRVLLISKLLNRHIESKLLYLDFLRTLPAGKEKEILEGISKQVQEEFHSTQVPKLMEQLNVDNLTDLDLKLRKYGSSVAKQQEQFREQAIAQTMIGKSINRYPVVTHKELLDEYHDHVEDYKFPARARWEKLTASFEEMPNKADAERHIVEMGNQVLRGAKFATVAERFSHGANRHDGGAHDWTSKGSLVSEVLDNAVFTLPIGRMSRILEDDTGYHIVRVIERREAGQVDFTKAQAEIRDKLQAEKRTEQIRSYVEKLRSTTRVTTVFDQQNDEVAQQVATQRPLR